MDEGTEFLEIEPEWSDQFSLTIQRMRTCYKITPKFKNYVHQKGQVGKLVITVDEAVDLETKFSKFVIYLSSEAGSYGIESGSIWNGEPFMTELKLETQRGFAIKPKKSVYLKETSDCSHESFWELVEPKFVSEVGDLCPLPCTPLGTPNRTLKMCMREENQVSL